jgi:hypothetical protein
LRRALDADREAWEAISDGFRSSLSQKRLLVAVGVAVDRSRDGLPAVQRRHRLVQLRLVRVQQLLQLLDGVSGPLVE